MYQNSDVDIAACIRNLVFKVLSGSLFLNLNFTLSNLWDQPKDPNLKILDVLSAYIIKWKPKVFI